MEAYVTIIHVNRQFIAINAKHGKPVLPTYIIRYKSNKVKYAHAVELTGPCKLVDPRKNKQLKCGARAWIETDHPVKLIGSMTFQEAKSLKEKHM